MLRHPEADTVPDAVLDWLLCDDEPSVRYGVLVGVLDEPADSPRARRARARIARSPRAEALLAGQEKNGGFGCHPYTKWAGSHWRLLRLADLNYPPGKPAVKRAADHALAWAMSNEPRTTAGRVRRCASQEGAALFYCVRLMSGDDPRAAELAKRLARWQWPDGGWNCDRRPEADHSSFHESLLPLWGLAEYWRVTNDPEARLAMDGAAELLLCHHLFRRDHDPERSVIHPDFVRLHYPCYWHYDLLEGCRALALAGKLNDPRAAEALDLIESKRRADGTWAPDRVYWRPPHVKSRSAREVVEWARRGQPDRFLTLNALRVLKTAGRLGRPDD